MSSAPNISSSIAPNPFGLLPPEIVESILDRIDDPESRLTADYVCKLFSSFTPRLLEVGEKWIKAYPNSEPFYPFFKKRMRQLNVEFPSDTFKICIGNFNSFFFSHLPLKIKELLPATRTFYAPLYEGFFDDVILSYADQDIIKMTPENYRRTIHFLTKNFLRSPASDIETRVRKRITKFGTDQHGQRTAEIEKIRCEFVNLAPDSPRFQQMQRSLIAELKERKERLEKRRLELDGPDGLIDAAIRGKLQAQDEIALAVRKAGEAMAKRSEEIASEIASGEYSFNSTKEILPAITHLGAFALSALDGSKCRQKMVAPASLIDELHNIVQCNPSGQMIGGELFQIQQALQPDAIARRARFKTKQLADFFKELNLDVAEGQESIRAKAMLAICGRKQQ